ncbi:MAG: hypothetical protein ACTS78_01165 [Arsenophonus sp. NC-WZS1-MAG3]
MCRVDIALLGIIVFPVINFSRHHSSDFYIYLH